MITPEKWAEHFQANGLGFVHKSLLTRMAEEIQKQTLIHVQTNLQKRRDAIYVGSNPIREGIKRGYSDAIISTMELEKRF